MKSKKILFYALTFPILILALLTGYKKYLLTFGSEVVLPISGYDPRDLLSGHYLIYQIDYGVDGICSGSINQETGYICLSTKQFSYSVPNSCPQVIRGLCRAGRFDAGVEKYYIPEGAAKKLEDQVRAKAASIQLSLSKDGRAQVKDLLIDGRSWKKQ